MSLKAGKVITSSVIVVPEKKEETSGDFLCFVLFWVFLQLGLNWKLYYVAL